MIKTQYNVTSVSANFTKTFPLESWRKRPGAIQISWSNLAGTTDGIINIYTKMEDSHNFCLMKKIFMSGETDNSVYIALDLFCKVIKIEYIKNNITNVDFIISSAE